MKSRIIKNIFALKERESEPRKALYGNPTLSILSTPTKPNAFEWGALAPQEQQDREGNE